MAILVTGGAGFIGSHIVEHFHNQAEVRVLDNFRSGFKRNLAGLRHSLVVPHDAAIFRSRLLP